MSLHVHNDIEQGTDAWHDLRRGMVTASTVGQLVSVGTLSAEDYLCPTCLAEPNAPCLSQGKGAAYGEPILSIHRGRTALAAECRDKPSATQIEPANNDTSRALTALLVAERITGHTDPTWQNDDMFRGQMCEPIARDYYSGYHQQAIEVGFMVREEDGWTLGYSPDGVVADDGLVEIKSPRAKAHLKTILANEVPAQYVAQLQAGLLVTGRKWIDYVSFCGGMPLFVKRVHPDPVWHAAIIAACQQFETTATEMVAAYRNATKNLPATERITELEMSL